jgi:hypothetical protein
MKVVMVAYPGPLISHWIWEYIALFDHDDELTPDALYWAAKEINDHPEVDFIYSDECKIDEIFVSKSFLPPLEKTAC